MLFFNRNERIICSISPKGETFAIQSRKSGHITKLINNLYPRCLWSFYNHILQPKVAASGDLTLSTFYDRKKAVMTDWRKTKQKLDNNNALTKLNTNQSVLFVLTESLSASSIFSEERKKREIFLQKRIFFQSMKKCSQTYQVSHSF